MTYLSISLRRYENSEALKSYDLMQNQNQTRHMMGCILEYEPDTGQIRTIK